MATANEVKESLDKTTAELKASMEEMRQRIDQIEKSVAAIRASYGEHISPQKDDNVLVLEQLSKVVDTTAMDPRDHARLKAGIANLKAEFSGKKQLVQYSNNIIEQVVIPFC